MYGPGHWENLYREGRTPWDAGGVPEELIEHLRARPGRGRALVPGCGSGYESATLAAAGFDVLAIDFSPAAVQRARALVGASGVRVETADFFEHDTAGYALIYERAFLCALPPRLRRDWAERCTRLLAPGGLLLGYFYLGETAADGPPFAIPRVDLEALLGDAFECLEDRPSRAPLPVFGRCERWQRWRRRDDA